MKSVIKLLTNQLKKENDLLSLCQENINHSDALNRRWAEGNIPSCQIRITELEKALKIISDEK